MGRFFRGRRQQQCPAQARSSYHCAQSSALDSARLPSATNSEAHLAEAPGLSEEALKKELKNLEIRKGKDGSTTLSFQVKANSYRVGYAFENGHSNGGPATVIQSRDRCGRVTTSKSTDLSGRYRVETSPQKDGSVAFTVKLDASLTRARLSLGDKSLVIDPNALKAGDSEASTPEKAPDKTPSTRPYDEPSYDEDSVPSPSDMVVPDSDTDRDTGRSSNPDEDPFAQPKKTTPPEKTDAPKVRDTPPVIQKVAPPETSLENDEIQTANGESTSGESRQPAPQEPKEQIVRPELQTAPARNQEVEAKVAAVATAVAGKTTAEGDFPFKVNNFSRSYSENYGGMVGYMHVDAENTPEMRTLWSLSNFRKDGQWKDYPLEGYDENDQVSRALKELPKEAPDPETVRPLRYSNGEGTEGYAFPRWTEDGERGTLVVQKSEHLPPSVAYVYDRAAKLARAEGEEGGGLKTFTAIEMPESEKKWEGNVHGWLAPDGRVLFTYKQQKTYRIYDPLDHIDHVRERRFLKGSDDTGGRYATLKSSWDNGYQPPQQPTPDGFSAVDRLKSLWGR